MSLTVYVPRWDSLLHSSSALQGLASRVTHSPIASCFRWLALGKLLKASCDRVLPREASGRVVVVTGLAVCAVAAAAAMHLSRISKPSKGIQPKYQENPVPPPPPGEKFMKELERKELVLNQRGIDFHFMDLDGTVFGCPPPIIDPKRRAWTYAETPYKRAGDVFPFCWVDVPEELRIGVLCNKATSRKNVHITLQRNHVLLEVNGEKLLNGRLLHDIDPERSSWRLGDFGIFNFDKAILLLTLKKVEPRWWKTAFRKVEPRWEKACCPCNIWVRPAPRKIKPGEKVYVETYYLLDTAPPYV